MADPLSITLGVIPLVGVVCKSYAAVHKKFSTFSHYSSTVARFQKQLKLQRRIFENEIHLLLRLAIHDDFAIKLMRTDQNHENWADDELDQDLRDQLGDNCQPCLDIIQEVERGLTNLQEKLGVFDQLKKHKLKNEKLKHTVKRLRGRVEITWNESDYEAAIKEVKSANCDLTGLREQISALRDTAEPSKASRRVHLIPSRTDWTSVCKIRSASEALHHGLSDVWSCGDADHLRHLVKMFLTADVKAVGRGSEIHMNLAVLCPATSSRPQQASLLPLLVRCQQREWLEIKRPLTPSDSGPELQPRKRKKVVRFQVPEQLSPHSATDTEAQGASLTSHHPKSQIQATAICDLRGSKELCSKLAASVASEIDTDLAPCLGFIDAKVQSDHGFRYSFYPQMGPLLSKGAVSRGMIGPGDVMSLDDLLSTSTDRALTYVERLRLAHFLVKTVLQCHSTPWMREVWRLSDLTFFRSGNDLPAWLQTLHLGVEFTREGLNFAQVQNASSSSESSTYMEGVLPTPPSSDTSRTDLASMSEDSRLLCGIENFPLHCLGVALLQIDHWKQLEPEDILTARKLARRPSNLTPRFPGMVQKCLRCDFGCGYDLGGAKLQKAVYEGLVEPLEEMISKLDLGTDD
ncbi:hypothetical protein QBC44DRAFT_105218 [Cladorrhinum sp. PSN332]|nr:hypothetical protein QBC44DRAFT_105218 [Cladorrhinum sp. PSN332]